MIKRDKKEVDKFAKVCLDYDIVYSFDNLHQNLKQVDKKYTTEFIHSNRHLTLKEKIQRGIDLNEFQNVDTLSFKDLTNFTYDINDMSLNFKNTIENCYNNKDIEQEQELQELQQEVQNEQVQEVQE